MLWFRGSQWALLRQSMPGGGTAAGCAAAAILLCLYYDRHQLLQLLLETAGVADLRTKFSIMEQRLEQMEDSKAKQEERNMNLMNKIEELEEQRLQQEEDSKAKQLEYEHRITMLERKVIILDRTVAAMGSTRKRPSATFFALPQELRDKIYDLVTFDEWRPGFCPWFPSAGSKNRSYPDPPNYQDPALAQVSRQIRAEFLPRFHRLMLVTFDPPIRPRAERWLKAFEARLPLIRNFTFQGWPFTAIRLSGGFPCQDGMVVSIPTKEEGYRVDPLFDRFDGRYLTHLQQLVESVLIRGEDGVAYLSIEALRTIGNFKWSFDFEEYERDPENFVFTTAEEDRTLAAGQIAKENEWARENKWYTGNGRT